MVTNTERIQANNDDLRECIEIAESLPNAGGEVAEPIIEPLEVTENGTYTAPDGVDGYSPVVVNVPIPDGYIVPSGELEVTENGTHDVTQYASVKVNVESSGGGNELDDMMTNKLTALDSDVASVRQYAFRGATALVSVNLPKATNVATNAFYGCSKLTSVNMPLVNTMGDNVFNSCSVLASIVLPSLTSCGSYTFRACPKLVTVDLPKIPNIAAGLFYYSYVLRTVILRSETLVPLANTNAFTNCYHITGVTNNTYNPNGLKDGYIYVPKTLIEDYKSATNWSTYATQFRAIEDYPEICGG